MENEILEKSQYLILHNDDDDDIFPRQLIEIASSTKPDNLSWKTINENEKLIIANHIISFLQNHLNI